MAPTKPGRPLVYEAESERPVTVSLRVPRDLYTQVQRYVRMRPPMTMTEFLLDATRFKLETPTDPRDIILSDDNTIIHELQTMVEAAVEAALARRGGQEAVASHAPAQASQQESMPQLSHDDNTVLRRPQYKAEPGHSIVTEPAPTRKAGRQYSPERQQILDLLANHPEGLSGEQIRVYINAEKPLGDTLQGMKRTGAVITRGSGKTLRYMLATR